MTLDTTQTSSLTLTLLFVGLPLLALFVRFGGLGLVARGLGRLLRS